MRDDETKKRGAAIKLAKELKSFDIKLGEQYIPTYTSTLTEDVKQLARENKKFAAVIKERLCDTSIEVDGQSEDIPKLMNKYAYRTVRSCNLLYEVANIVNDAVEEILAEDEYEGDE